jgi:hypothetical protein
LANASVTVTVTFVAACGVVGVPVMAPVAVSMARPVGRPVALQA